MSTIAIIKQEFVDIINYSKQTSLKSGEVLEIVEFIYERDYQSSFLVTRSTGGVVRILQHDFYKWLSTELVEELLNQEYISLPTKWLVLDENNIEPK